MAKNEKALAKKQEDELAAFTEGLMGEVLPDFVDAGERTEAQELAPDEVRLPRLSIAQALSPQVLENKPEFIEDLRTGDLFNDLTKEIYGRGPVLFAVAAKADRYIEFIPREEGGGIKDMDVKPGDPRTHWRTENGERLPPLATKFMEFIAVLLKPSGPETILLSIKDTNKHSRAAGSALKMMLSRPWPSYTMVFSLKTISVSNDQGTWFVPVIEAVPGKLQKRDLIDYIRGISEAMKGKKIVANREGDEGDDSFDPEQMERESEGRPKMY